jgi:hypothetical protein
MWMSADSVAEFRGNLRIAREAFELANETIVIVPPEEIGIRPVGFLLW